ncbi:MAG: hypothetical protein E6G94_15645 [Alphaproteobacteria bacterium]|nr:MAG: hypothetical protein E6G94_15645 [Alphaproteobacteria bacterium]
MNKVLLTALAAASALAIASPAAAQTATGVVNITGNVDSKCIVIAPGTPTGGNAFGGTVSLGNLAQANGTLESTATLESRFAAAGAANLEYRVVCTAASTKISVDADPITTAAASTTGYSNTVQYQANVAVLLANSTPTPLVNDSLAVAATETTYPDRLKASVNNIIVTASNFRSAAATDVMLAGAYTGKITIIVTPTA